MGRYLSGDWDWKFAFGDQGSTFGEVISELVNGCEDIFLNRYIGTDGEGEKLELTIDSDNGWKNFKRNAREFIGKGFKKKGKREMTKWCHMDVKFDDGYWDKLMIKKFVKDFNGRDFNGDTFYFYVEY